MCDSTATTFNCICDVHNNFFPLGIILLIDNYLSSCCLTSLEDKNGKNGLKVGKSMYTGFRTRQLNSVDTTEFSYTCPYDILVY